MCTAFPRASSAPSSRVSLKLGWAYRISDRSVSVAPISIASAAARSGLRRAAQPASRPAKRHHPRLPPAGRRRCLLPGSRRAHLRLEEIFRSQCCNLRGQLPPPRTPPLPTRVSYELPEVSQGVQIVLAAL